MKIKLKKLHEKATIPARVTDLAGGWDVTATEIIQESEDFVICKLGFALELPIGYKLTLVPRSSLTKTKWVLQNSPALIDADFRAEISCRFRALPTNDYWIEGRLFYDEFPYKVGDRVGQVYLEEVIPIKWEITDELNDTARGNGGFGSTGK